MNGSLRRSITSGMAILALASNGCCALQSFNQSVRGAFNRMIHPNRCCETTGETVVGTSGVVSGDVVESAPAETEPQITGEQPDLSKQETTVNSPRRAEPGEAPKPPPRRQPADTLPEPKKPLAADDDLPKLSPAPKPKPAGLSLKVASAKGIIALGQEVKFDVLLENNGGSAVDSVAMKAILSPNLKVKSVTPAGSATIDGNTVTFNTLKNLAPMQLKYQIVAEAAKLDGQVGKITLEANSAILESGPLKQEAITRITEK